MDFLTKPATHETTVRIPVADAQWVKDNGMTFSGAFRMGLKAMQERKSWNEELRDVTANMEKYRARMLRLEEELRALGKKVE